MSLGLLFVTALVIGFSGAITPGPLFVACLTRSARDGFWGGVWTTVGHAFMELVVVLGLALGLGAVLLLPGVVPAIRLAGGLVLVWLGWGTVRPAWKGDMSLPDPEHTGSDGAATGAARRPGALASALTGIAATVSGPYWVVWWATVGLSYLTLARPSGAAGVGAFYLGHVSADFAWYAAVALAVAGGRRLLGGAGYRSLLIACGLLLIGLGVWFAGTGLANLAGM